jgi:hypothetical protein
MALLDNHGPDAHVTQQALISILQTKNRVPTGTRFLKDGKRN